MTMTHARLAGAVLAGLLLAGCWDDPARPPKDSQEIAVPEFREPTTRENVLFNLELSCNLMDAAHYAATLDPTDFVFYFDLPDNMPGPDAWGFAEEKAAVTYMFARAGGLRGSPIRSVDVTLVGAEDAVWIEVDPGDPFPGETWYRADVQYKFSVKSEDDTVWITGGKPRAQFTLRPHDAGGTTEWTVVQWRDIPGTPRLASRAPTGTEEITWSVLKYMYSGDGE
jgi:hypothetical protein